VKRQNYCRSTERSRRICGEISVNLCPDQFNVIYYDYIGRQEKVGGGRMVKLWMGKDERGGLE
jgi:hypothetical protein